MLLDLTAAYDFAAALYPARRIIVSGESLGTGVAVALAAEREIGGLILDAPFTSAADIGASAYPFIPVRWFIKDSFRSDERIGRVKAPLLVLHGEQDRIVPIRFGERLFALANEPKRMVRFRPVVMSISTTMARRTRCGHSSTDCRARSIERSRRLLVLRFHAVHRRLAMSGDHLQVESRLKFSEFLQSSRQFLNRPGCVAARASSTKSCCPVPERPHLRRQERRALRAVQRAGPRQQDREDFGAADHGD